MSWRRYRARRWLIAAMPIAGLLVVAGWFVLEEFRVPVPPPVPPGGVFIPQPATVAWQFEPDAPADIPPEPASASRKLELPSGDWRTIYPATPSQFVLLQAGPQHRVL